MEHMLAIVIPAYKPTYLRDCLQSIVQQTCNKFAVYIGDDASPYDLRTIVSEFEDRIELHYKRFDFNQGGINLVDHWHRCIEMSREPWIWLFSDDDLMDPCCVQTFYEALENTPGANQDIFHFNTLMIDKKSETFLHSKKFPRHISSAEFLKMIFVGGYHTFAVEYIFRRSVYLKEDGFVPFDLAWGSDSATWLKLGRERGIYTLDKGMVKWRFSGDNISSIRADRVISERKILADLYFLRWALSFLKKHNVPDISTKKDKIFWVIRQLYEKPYLNRKRKHLIIKLYLKAAGIMEYSRVALLFSHLYAFKQFLKKILVGAVPISQEK